MIPLAAIKYTIYSAILVISLFLGIRCLFAHEVRREHWRSVVKQHIYISRPRFKTITISAGWILLLIALSVAYFQIVGLMDAE